MTKKRNVNMKKAIGGILNTRREPMSMRQIADALSDDNHRYFNFSPRRLGQVMIGAKGIKVVRKTSLKGKLYEMVDKRIYDRWVMGED